MSSSENSENKLVEWFAAQSRLDGEKFPIGIGDDMAQINLGAGKSVLITTDMLLDGSHFDLATAGIEAVGYKAMATSISDCAAMATVPIAAVVSVGLCKGMGGDDLKLLHKGIIRAGKMFGCELVGGDMTSWKESFVISVTMLSTPGPTEPLKRSGAKCGDVICVTGSLGGSLVGRHLEFVPRVNEALAIARAGGTAMTDISDGLSTDLNHVCQMSGAGAIIESEKLPLSEVAKNASDPIKSALSDGEDFELLFTMASDNFEKLLAVWDMPTAITAIGSINNTGDVCIKGADGKTEKLLPAGYDHLLDKQNE